MSAEATRTSKRVATVASFAALLIGLPLTAAAQPAPIDTNGTAPPKDASPKDVPSMNAPSKDAPSKEECATANETAQTLRQERKLKAARAQLLVCIAKSCPGAVRDDCAERLDDIERATPTIIFSVRDARGADLTDVRVLMDGELLAPRLDIVALAVDPGEHTFELVAEGYPPVVRSLLIREGVKRRHESIVLGTPDAPTDAPTPPSAAPARAADVPSPTEQRGRMMRIVSYSLAGAGVVALGVGTYFGLKAKSTYDDASQRCATGPSSCDADGIKGGSDAHDQASVATAAFVAGGALLTGAAIVFFTAPRPAKIAVQPSVAPTNAGLHIVGTF